VARGTLRSTGSLKVSKKADIAHTVKVEGQIGAGSIEVGGKMFAGSVACAGPVTVGGIVEVAKTLEAGSVDVGGQVRVRGAVKAGGFDVGGKADVGGGTISGAVRVKGSFESRGPLEFGDLQVYGRCNLAAGSKGQRVSTFGRLVVGGAFSCDDVKVEGATDIGGDLNAGKVLANGKLSVKGLLAVAGAIESSGFGDVTGEVSGTDLRVGGRFRAKKIVLTNEAEVAGELETQEGLKAKSVKLGSGTRCRGPLVGERVEIGKSSLALLSWGGSWAGQSIRAHAIGRMTDAQDLYGDEVVLGRNSRCWKIFAKRVEVADGCIAEQVVYTEELRGATSRAFFTRPPERAQSLPPFPL